GDLMIDFPEHHNVTNYKRQLDLKTALASTSYQQEGVNYQRTYFVSGPQNLLAVKLSANKKGKISFKTYLASKHDDYELRKVDDYTIALKVKVKHGVLFGESYLRVIANKGKVSIKNNSIEVSN